MVVICSPNYPIDSENKYKSFFDNYSFPLSNFQKYSIEAIVEGQHVLVNVPTGSGKTLSGEFAIEYFVKKGKKVIYTCPIKALSNQKYHDFTEKYTNISIGILTGDIKSNPDADVLIMTAEILKNKLYQLNPNTDFNIDIQNELGCVVMDEVHYINDKERGKVWEETILMLPPHVQMVMLSATLDKPESFAKWVEHKGNFDVPPNKQVYLTPQVPRIVPLQHYSFITCTTDIFKQIKDKQTEKEIKDSCNKFLLIQDEKNNFQAENYKKVQKTLTLLQQKRIHTKRAYVVNEALKLLKEKEMLPALCFVLSKKNIEVMAKEITIPLLEFDSKIPYEIARECEQIIRRLPNYKEILTLPEYQKTIQLLEKGIAIHHAGVLPIIREMVEILFSKGYIKLLFATETFAVGINMPTKAVIFTGIHKYDGNQNRMFHSHEFTQMAGRAGRRGIDKEGFVIHLNNLFMETDTADYKCMMKGNAQKLESKFSVSYSLVLESMENKQCNIDSIIQNSLINTELNIKIRDKIYCKNELEQEISRFTEKMNGQLDVVREYNNLLEERQYAKNSQRKAMDKRIHVLKNEHVDIEKYISDFKILQIKEKEIDKVNSEIQYHENFLKDSKQKIFSILADLGYLDQCNEITSLGKHAIQIKEMDSLIASQLIQHELIHYLSATDIICLFSCFVDIPTSEENRVGRPSEDSCLNVLLEYCEQKTMQKMDLENKYKLYSDTKTIVNYDLINYCKEWCVATDIAECNRIIDSLVVDKQIFLGDFCKILVKINNIAKEWLSVAEQCGYIALMSHLIKIPDLLLKYVISNQSLYV